MVNESNKIIVKVGKKSKVRFANSKVYRALTSNDLVVLTTNHDDCQIVVIEDISEDEQEAVRDFAKQFKEAKENNSVLFYIPDETDEITSGIADELDYNIYLTDRDLYKAVYDKYGINVSVYLDDKKRLNSQGLSELGQDGIPDIFGSIGGELETEDDDISQAIAAIDEADSKEVNEQGSENLETPIEKQDTSINSEIETSNTDDMSDIFGTDISSLDDTATPIEKQDTSIKEEVKHSKKKTTLAKVEKQDTSSAETPIEKQDTSIKEEVKHSEEVKEIMSADTAEYIENLKMQLRDAKYDYSEAVKDIREANARMTSLEDTIRLLKEEKESIVKRFEELMVSDDILEDPISLAEYSVIKENADNLESQVLDLKSTIDSLKETVEEKELDINSAETSIEELKSTIDSLKEQLSEANKSIESGEAFKEQVEDYEAKLKSVLEEKAKVSSRLLVVEEDNEKLRGDVSDTTLRADEETATRIETFELLTSTILKIKELDDKLEIVENEKSELIIKLETTEKQLKDSKNTIRDNLETITKLEKSVNDSDKKMELANNSSANELNKLRDRISQLQTKLSVTEQQLAQKENQYNTLVSTSGIDENGANALVETNKTLETISKTLREQLGVANRELEKARRGEAEANKQLSGCRAQVATLQKSLKSIAAASGNSMSSGNSTVVRPLNIGYSHAQIITVFGSGSFGITTTAMSLAEKLSATSKVLYIDFDTVSPMADSWFKIYPFINNIPGTINGIQNSGLGIFVEHGTSIVNQYMSSIIKSVRSTKGGGLHYLSGLYYRPDSFKLATADYEGLLSLLCKNFQYIVIDFGKLGCNEVSDQLIKVISDVAYKNVVVTTANYFEVRNFTTKLNDLNIKMESIAWLFNMSTSVISSKVKDLVSKSKYEIMPRTEIYGNQDGYETFLKSSQTRDRFSIFVDRSVFSK